MEGLLKKVYNSPKLALTFRICCYIVTLASACVFIYMLASLAASSLARAAGLSVALGVPFLLVSLTRRLINSPRPYQIYDFYIAPPKKRQGESFPSRHAFSVFAIGTMCLFFDPLIGTLSLVAGVIMCFCRVALGMHFVRDVICGAFIGIFSSVIGALILL